jgi:single-stranded-DNA-specific exonuclease
MKLVGEVLHNNNMRVNLQAEAETLALELVKDMDNADFLFVAHEKFHRGVVGLIATKLSQTFQKPAFVGAISEDGTVVGSARAPQASGCNLVKALESCEQQMVRFGGHALAAGFEYESTKIEFIQAGLKGFFESKGSASDTFADIVYDSEVDLDEISPTFMNWIEMLGPYGHSFDAPVFLIKNLKITGSRSLKGGHLKLKLRKERGGKAIDSEALLFSPMPEQIDLLAKAPVVDVLAESQWNYYQGRRTVQILIKEIRPAVGQQVVDLVN